MLKIRTRAEAKLPPKLALTWDQEPDSSENPEQNAELAEEEQAEQASETTEVVADKTPEAEAATEPKPLEQTEQQEIAEPAAKQPEEAAAEPQPAVAAELPQPAEPPAMSKEEVAETTEQPAEVQRTDNAKAEPPAETVPAKTAEAKPSEIAKEAAAEAVAAATEKTEENATEQSAEPEVIQIGNQEFAAEVLDRLRCEAGVTLRDVSSKTQIPQAFLVDFKERRFENLPDLNTCLSRIGKLCQELGADKQPILDKFTQEYNDYVKEHNVLSGDNHPGSHTVMSNRPGGFDIPNSRWAASVPSLIILFFIFMLIGILVYAVISYYSKVPEKIDADLTEFVRPIKVVVPDMDQKHP